MWNFFRACAQCGVLWPPIDLYCEPCWQNLLSQGQLELHRDGHATVQSLWRWSRKDIQLAQYLKIRKHAQFAATQHRLFSLYKQQGLRVEAKHLVYTSKRESTQHHAQFAAKIFAQYYSFENLIGIEIKPSLSYKTQGRRERKLRREAVAPAGSPIEKSDKFCFLDDVYTTGATAEAVWRALGRPSSYQIVVIAHKTLK